MKKKIIKGRTGFCMETLELKLTLEKDFVELGRRLFKIKSDGLWQGGWESWPEYLQEIKLKDSTASRLIRIYEQFVLQCGFAPAQIAKAGGWTVLAETLPMIKSREDAVYWFEVASGMRNRTDLRRTLHEEKHGTNMMTCEHKDTFTIQICRTCGLRTREYDEEKL